MKYLFGLWMAVWFITGATLTGWDVGVLIGSIIWGSITFLLLKYLPKVKTVDK